MRFAPGSVLVLSVIPAFASADIVFDNFSATPAVFFESSLDVGTETDSTVEMPGGFENFSRVGDVASLTGTDRFVNQFEVRLLGDSVASGRPGAAELVLEIYTVSGGLPGALLWTGEQTVGALPADFNYTTVAFAPNITVPDSIAWSIRFKKYRDAVRTSYFGLSMDRTSSIRAGGSPLTYLVQHSDTGAWETISVGSIVDGAARISAVPSPGSASLLAVSLIAARRRRR